MVFRSKYSGGVCGNCRLMTTLGYNVVFWWLLFFFSFGGGPLGVVFSFSISTTTTGSSSVTTQSSAFEKACIAFEKAHAEDPRIIQIKKNDNEGGEEEEVPYSVHYHRRMVYWLDRLLLEQQQQQEEAVDVVFPVEVQLAARCQHIRRWERPRTDYPKGLKGYKDWRTDLNVYHAEQASQILLDAGYSHEVVNRVGQLLRKENLLKGEDKDVQLLEDVICIVFLENEYTTFIEKDEYNNNSNSSSKIDDDDPQEEANKEADDKLVRIVQKTWKKMTPLGHKAALTLTNQLTDRGLRLVKRALEEEKEEAKQ